MQVNTNYLLSKCSIYYIKKSNTNIATILLILLLDKYKKPVRNNNHNIMLYTYQYDYILTRNGIF